MVNIPVAIRPTPAAPMERPPVSEAPTKPTACATCVRRKVKCDRTQPCSTCRTGSFICEYLEPLSKKRKRKDFDELHDRLDRYEHLLVQHGILAMSEGKTSLQSNRMPVSQVGAQHNGPTITSPGNHPVGTEKASSNPGLLVKGPEPGQTRYVESYLWRDLGDDLHPSSDDEDEPATASALAQDTTTYPSPADLASAGMFGASPSLYNLAELHPTPQEAIKLWHMYLRNVDPILKFVHGPSTTKLFEKFSSNTAAIPKEIECLFFAIYHFAIVSMSDDERLEMLGPSWREIQKRYHDATRQGLLSCSFYQTTSLTVLQAYTLLLISMRFQYNPHTFWILSGIAVRLAQRMGLHTQDERELNPFDVEMRRRMWWYVLITDNFAAQQAGTTVETIPADSWDAPRPLNIDDKDIWPGMTEQPKEKHGATDMIVYLVRVEITTFRAKLGRLKGQRSPDEMEASMRELEDTVELNFLRYCDITDPTHYVITVGARGALLNARLRTRLARVKTGKASETENNEVFAMSLKLLDHDFALTSNPLASRYAWQQQVFFSWEPLICALKELCQEQDPEQDDKAWEKIGRVFDGHPNIVTPTRSIEIALGRLALRAWDLTQRRSPVHRQEPTFIKPLGESFRRRTEARNSSEEVRAKSEQSASQQPFPEPLLGQGFSFGDQGVWDEWGADIDWKFWDEMIRSSALEPGTP